MFSKIKLSLLSLTTAALLNLTGCIQTQLTNQQIQQLTTSTYCQNESGQELSNYQCRQKLDRDLKDQAASEQATKDKKIDDQLKQSLEKHRK